MARVTGLADLSRVLAELPDTIRVRVLQDAAREGGAIIADGASVRAPRLTGQLASDILVETQLTGQGVTVRVGPSRDSFYGLFQELGTPHHAAQPFLRPALDEEGDRARLAMARRFAEGVEREAARLARSRGRR